MISTPNKTNKGEGHKTFFACTCGPRLSALFFGCSTIVIYAGKQTRALFNRLGLLEKSSSFLVS